MPTHERRPESELHVSSNERKLGILRDAYAMLDTEAQTGRMELLEAVVVLLIFADLSLSSRSRSSDGGEALI